MRYSIFPYTHCTNLISLFEGNWQMYIISSFWSYFCIFKMTKGTLACWGSGFSTLWLSNSPPRCMQLRSPYISVGRQTLGFRKENKISSVPNWTDIKIMVYLFMKLHITKETGEFYRYVHYIYQRREVSYFIYLKEQKPAKIICNAYGYTGGKAIKKSKKIKIKVRITLGG